VTRAASHNSDIPNSMQAASLQPAYALHSRRYRESSMIVEFITRDHGRVALLAKGAIGGKQSRQQLLQPFSPLLIAWRGRGELPLLTSLESAQALPQVAGRTLYCGFYVNELVLKLTERYDAHSDIFIAYSRCMQDLIEAAGDNVQLELALRFFELRLLNDLGHGLLLDVDQQGREIDPMAEYHYDLDAGPTPSTQGEHSINGATLRALANNELSSDLQRKQARQLMRRILAHHLGGRQLKSRELFKTIATP